MLRRVHGWKYRTFPLITYLKSAIYTTRMGSPSSWNTPLNAGRNSNIVGDIAPAAAGVGRGRGVPQSTNRGSSSSVPGNAHGKRPAQKKGSFGGAAAVRSRLQAEGNGNPHIQFGSVESMPFPPVIGGAPQSTALPETVDPVEVSSVVPVAVVNHEIEAPQLAAQKTGDGEVHPAPKVRVENAVPQPPKASPNAAWGQVETAKDAVPNKGSDSSNYPSFSASNDDDFPALGAAPRGNSKLAKQRWKPENVEPAKRETLPSLNPTVDMSRTMEVPPKLDERRESGSSGAEVKGHGREEQNKSWRGRGRDQGRDHISSLGRTLTRILRHQALELKIKLRSDGYVEVKELLKLPMKTASGRPLRSHTVEDVLQAVEEDNKQRFGIKEENGVLFIRANQGHTIKAVETEQLLVPVLNAEQIPVCVHGTYWKFLDSIVKQGLKRMSRNHVHFATGLAPTDGVISGMRKTSEVLIYLDVSKALEDGMKLYISENGVILTEGFDGVVPPKYFKEICSWPDHKPVKIS